VDQVGEGWEVPTEVKDRVQFHWFHVYPGKALLLCFLSPAALWYVGHYEGGRMRLCIGEGCELCEKGCGKQIRYVVSAVEVTTRKVGVIEVGESIALTLKDLCSRNGGLRGMIVECMKATKSKHSRMEMVPVHEAPPAWALALAPLDLREVLEKTWQRQGS